MSKEEAPRDLNLEWVFENVTSLRKVMFRTDRKSEVRQCLGFCSTDSEANEGKQSALRMPCLRLPISTGDVAQGPEPLSAYLVAPFSLDE